MHGVLSYIMPLHDSEAKEGHERQATEIIPNVSSVHLYEERSIDWTHQRLDWLVLSQGSSSHCTEVSWPVSITTGQWRSEVIMLFWMFMISGLLPCFNGLNLFFTLSYFSTFPSFFWCFLKQKPSFLTCQETSRFKIAWGLIYTAIQILSLS